MAIFVRNLICGLCLIILLNGCAFFKLKKELAGLEDVYALRGKIIYSSSHKKDILVVVYEKTPDDVLLNQAVIGEFKFKVSYFKNTVIGYI